MADSETVEIGRNQLLFLREQYNSIQGKLAESQNAEARLESKIQRMQMLSKSQTFLLKDALHKKLQERDGSSADALEILRLYEGLLEETGTKLPEPAVDPRSGAPYSEIYQAICERQRDECRRDLDTQSSDPV
eukprot:CAMPEP_0194588520 /NCGR_PEP_ID=MMETSP0292-20121207/19851_1 /TAXON_ID=39354 /ORGANISM="Heterosigma akashiwo, Strain CCMP2393" /LENGTH=132 /DNA_ID=CAMNT_0039445083 /DNA_START=25 /DNA_END=420 /DNA_ORIENTATION=-